MDPVELLLPLIEECRHNFEDCSLVLSVHHIHVDQIGAANVDTEVDCVLGEKFKQYHRSVDGLQVTAVTKQTLHMISDPCIDIDDLYRTMHPVDVIYNPVDVLSDPYISGEDYGHIRAWRDADNSRVLIRTFSPEEEQEDEQFTTDEVILQLVSHVLHLHTAQEVRITAVREAFFPIAAYKNLYILSEYSGNETYNIRIYNRDGWKVAQLLSVEIQNARTENGRTTGLHESSRIYGKREETDERARFGPSSEKYSGNSVLQEEVSTKNMSRTPSQHSEESSTSAMRQRLTLETGAKGAGVPVNVNEDETIASDRTQLPSNAMRHDSVKQLRSRPQEGAIEDLNNECASSELLEEERTRKPPTRMQDGGETSSDTTCNQRGRSELGRKQKEELAGSMTDAKGYDRHELRQKIRRILGEIIGNNRVKGDDKTFVWLGVDSLKMASFESRLQREFAAQFVVPVGCTLRHPTVSSLTDYFYSLIGVKPCMVTAVSEFDRADRQLRGLIAHGEPIPLSAAQKRLVFMAKFEPENDSQFIEKVALKLDHVHIQRLSTAFNKLVARQSILRTVYSTDSQQVLSLTESYFAVRIQDGDVVEDDTGHLDIFAAPPLKVAVKASDGGYIFELFQHHISTDGYSIGVIMRELEAAYRGCQLNKLSFHYAHFAVLEQRRLLDTAYVRNRDNYWIRQFEHFESEKLLTDKPRKPSQTYNGHSVEYRLSESDDEALRYLASSCEVTEFALLLALYHILVNVSFNQTDFCTGISVAERGSEHLQSLAGCLVNIVPIRLRVNASSSVKDVVSEAAHAIQDSVQNQIPFERLLKLLNLERDMSSSPLFQVFLVMDVVDVPLTHRKPLESNGDILEGLLVEEESHFAKYDQVWYFVRSGDSLTIKVEYNTDLFQQHSVKRTIHEFLHLIRVCSDCPNALISGIGLETNAEKLHRYGTNLRNRHDFPMSRCPIEMITAQASMDVYCNGIVHDNVPYSSVFMQQHSNQLARAIHQCFMQHWGVVPRADIPIVILTHRSPELIQLVLALWKCGFIVVPLSVDWPKQRYYGIVKSLPYSAIITSDEFISKQELPVDCLHMRIAALINCSKSYPRKPLTRSRVVYDLGHITYTSGSTGIPKGVCSEMIGLNNLAMNYARCLCINRWSTVYQVVNHSFDIFFADLLEALTNGATLVLAKGRIADPHEMVSVSHAYIMPAYLATLDSETINGLRDCEAIKFGGDAVDTNFLWKATEAGLNLYQQYGLTEASVYSTMHRLRFLDKANCMGSPLRNAEFTLRAPDAERVMAGRRGILCLSGVGLSRGYINNEQLNASKYKADTNPLKEDAVLNYDKRYFITGDFTELDANGQMRFFGRADSQMKIRGQIVDLADLEAALRSVPMVEACVVTVRILKAAPVLVAHTIVQKDQRRAAEEKLQESITDILMQKIPSFMIPSYFFFLDAFPLNSNGKIDRQELQQVELPTEHVKRFNHSDGEMTAIEGDLCRIFSDVLGVPSVCLDDSFFAVGGDSLKALIAIQRIENELSIRIPLKDIFRYHTFGRILRSREESQKAEDVAECQIVHDRPQESYSSAPFERFWLDGNGIPLSFGQERLWFLQNYDQSTPLSYVLQMNLHLRGRVDIGALQRAINVIIRQHAVFRTIIRADASFATQTVLSLTESYVALFDDHRDTSDVTDFEMQHSPPFAIVMRSHRGGVDLFLYMHHILTDGHSFGIISAHLVEAYDRIVNNKPLPLVRLHENMVQKSYASFSYHQRRDFQELSKEHRDWMETFRDVEALEIPTDFVRPKVFDARGGMLSVDINVPRHRIDAFCARHHCTLFTYLLSAYSLLMRTLSSQRRFLVGTATANRDVYNADTVGFFANSVPLDVDTEGWNTVDELVSALQSVCIRNLQRQKVPFEVIVEHLNPPRDTSKAPLFQHSIVLHNASPVEMPEMDGVSIEVEEAHSGEAKYDQTWFFQPRGSTIRLQVEYCTALFHESTIQTHIQMFKAVAKSLLEAERLDQISFITDEERLREHERNHDFDSPRTSLPRIYKAQCQKAPMSEMLRWFDGDSGSCLTYGEAFGFIQHLSRIISQSMLRSSGTPTRADDCVAVISDENFISILAILAVQLTGCCYCPIDRNNPLKRIDFIRSDSKSKLVLNCAGTGDGDLLWSGKVGNDSIVELLVAEEFRVWRKRVGSRERRCWNRTSNTDMAYIIYTSGSTGQPKGVCVEQQSIVNVIEYTTRQYSMATNQRFYQFTKLTFDASLAYTFGAALNGATMCMRDENRHPVEDINRNLPLHLLHMTPAVLREIPEAQIKSMKPNVALLSVGGDKLDDRDMNKVIDNGIPLIQVYGPTEATVFQTTGRMKAHSHTANTIGPTISNLIGYVLDDGGKQLPSNARGEFFMVGENVARGYMNLTEETGRALVRNPLQTREDAAKGTNTRGYRSGDLVKRMPSREIVFFGRKDSQVKVNGYRVELGEIEAALCRLEGVSSSVAVHREGQVCAFIQGEDLRSEQEYMEQLSQLLPHYMMPSGIVPLKKFRLNQNGKIDRKAVQHHDSIDFHTDLETSDETEAVLKRIWSDVLKRADIGECDNFFALGGNSILATTICFRIREALHCECPIRLIFENQTIAKLTKRLTAKGEDHDRGRDNLSAHSRRRNDLQTLPQNPRNDLLTAPQSTVITNLRSSRGHSSKKGGGFGETQTNAVEPNVNSNIEPFRNDLSTNTDSDTVEACNNLRVSGHRTRRSPLRCCELQKPLLQLYFNNPEGDYLRAYETGFRIQLRKLDVPLIQKCLNRVIMRHDALRTSFFAESTEYFQDFKSASESFVAIRFRHQESKVDVPCPFSSVPVVSYLEEVDDHVHFVLRMSHVVTDGRSMQVIAHELLNLYRGHDLPPTNSVQYADFSEKYHRRSMEMKEENEKYWHNEMTCADVSIDIDDTLLETDKPRSGYRRSECRYVSKRLNKLNRIIERVSGKNNCSNFTVVTAAFSRVLSRRLRQKSKVVIGCPVDMRDDPSEDSVGLHIATVPILLGPLDEYPKKKLLKHTPDQIQGAIQHAAVSAEFLGSLFGDNELIRCMIVSDNFHDAAISEGRELTLLEENSQHTKYELSMFISQRGDDVLIRVEYAKELFYEETITDMILELAKRIGAFDRDDVVTDGDDRDDVIFNREMTSLSHANHLDDIPSFCFAQLIERVSESSPRNKSLFTPSELNDYSTLLRRVHRISAEFKQCAICATGEPLRADTVVPVIAKKSLDVLLICISIVFAGAAYLPIDRTNPKRRIASILQESRAILCMTDSDHDLGSGIATVPLARLFNHSPINVPKFKSQASSEDAAYVIFTSGTTGRPKGVLVHHKGLMNLAKQSARDFWMSATDCVYQLTNFTFDNSVLEMTMALSNASALYVEERSFSTDAFLHHMNVSNITHALMFPGLVEMFSDAELEQLSELRYWIVGAEKASDKLISKALDYGINVIQNYGPTETTAYALSKRMHALDHANNLGTPISNAYCVVRKWDGSVAPHLTCGELLIGGVGLMRGYLSRSSSSEPNMPEDKHQGRLYPSGDIVKPLRNGDVIFVGRRDEQVKIRGFRVEISEIEATLCQMREIRRCKVILMQEPLQILVAYIVLNDPKQSLDVDGVRQHCIQRLPHYMVPTHFKQINEFPLTSNNKVDVKRLPAVAESTESRTREPENVIEFELWRLFKTVLGIDRVSTDDDFFAIGGNSLRAMKLARRIKEEINLEVEVKLIFRHRTVRRLAEALKGTMTTNKKDLKSHSSTNDQPSPPIDYNRIPLSFQQQQILFLSHTKQADYYSLIFVQDFDTSIDYGKLRMAFLRLVMRQPALRTTFFESDYETSQALLSGTECYFSSQVEDIRQNHRSPFPRISFSEDDDPVCPVYCSVSRSDQVYTVNLLLSHIISDAWSTRLIETELSQLYAAICEGQFSDTRLAYTYAHYSVEQNARMGQLKKGADECADKLAPFMQNCRSISAIFGRTSQKQPSSTIECFQEVLIPDPDLSDRLNRCCAKLSSTNFVIALAAVAVSIHRLSKNTTFIIGAPAANRSAKTEALVGNFLNNLLIPSVWPEVTANTSSLNKSSKEKTTMMRTYIRSLSATVEEMRRFEFVPYTLLRDALKRRTKCGVDALYEVYVNCRYYLEDGGTMQIPSGNQKAHGHPPTTHESGSLPCPPDETAESSSHAPKCAHPIEVDVDLLGDALQFSIRIRADVGGEEDAQSFRMLLKETLEEIVRSAEDGSDTSEDGVSNEAVSNSWSSAIARPLSTGSAIGQGNDGPPSIAVSSLKLQLQTIWERCLQANDIDGNDDFFLIGGNSLICLKLKRMIAKELSVSLEIEEIFGNRIFTQMLELLELKLTRSKPKLSSTTLVTLYDDTNASHRLMVFFHPLIGGVTLPYAALIRHLVSCLDDTAIVGVEHPNTFAFNSDEPRLSGSIEGLCSVYVDDVMDTIARARSCLFIGASLGAILAYECAMQLRRRGIRIDGVISIDGGGQPASMPSITFEEHCSQMRAVISTYSHQDDQVDRGMIDAMIQNAWQLLQMVRKYRPKRSNDLTVNLLRVKGHEDDDYGWSKVARTVVQSIPGKHENMLSERNSLAVAKIVAEIAHSTITS